MAPPKRVIYGEIAQSAFIPNKGRLVTGINQSQLLSRLLLFDEVIIRSVMMGELPFLIKMFRVDGLEELLSQGVVKLSSDTVNVITDIHRNGRRELPLFQFTQGIVDIADRNKYVKDGLNSLLQVTGLTNARREAFAEFIQTRVLRPGPSYGADLLEQVRQDLRKNTKLVEAVLVQRFPERVSNLPGFKITLEEISPGVQRFNTNLRELLGTSSEEEHVMLSESVSAISTLNQKLADMTEYQAISTLEESDVPLLFGKIAGIMAPYNPRLEESSFLRVLEIAGIPHLLDSGRIDVQKLLEIRSSGECREFRAWLTSADQIDDAKLKSLLTGFRARAGSLIASPAGKLVRFAVNVGLGLIPGYGSATALAEGVVDNFLLDKMLPSPGVLSFLSKSVPSIISRT